MTTDHHRRLDAWRRYGYEQRHQADARTPSFLRRPDARPVAARSFSLGDLDPRSVRLSTENRGFDGASVALACMISFGAGIITCRILIGVF